MSTAPISLSLVYILINTMEYQLLYTPIELSAHLSARYLSEVWPDQPYQQNPFYWCFNVNYCLRALPIPLQAVAQYQLTFCHSVQVWSNKSFTVTLKFFGWKLQVVYWSAFHTADYTAHWELHENTVWAQFNVCYSYTIYSSSIKVNTLKNSIFEEGRSSDWHYNE